MYTSKLASIAALVLSVAAQTPPDFNISTSSNLLVTFGNTPVQPAGVVLPQAITTSQPTIAFPGAGKGKYVVIMMDIDVNLNGAKGNLVHWIQGNFASQGGSSQLGSPGTIIAPYFPPGPPPGENHRYVELLFNEPQGFTIPASFTAYFANLTASVFNRVNFPLDKFIDEAKLKTPVAANFFRVSNTNNTSSTSSSSATATGSRPNATAGAPTGSPTGSAPIPANSGVVDRVLSASMLAFLAMLGIGINMI